MINSLLMLNDFPPDTIIFPGHEYAKLNLSFALSLEKDNEVLKAMGKAAHDKRTVRSPIVSLYSFLTHMSSCFRLKREEKEILVLFILLPENKFVRMFSRRSVLLHAQSKKCYYNINVHKLSLSNMLMERFLGLFSSKSEEFLYYISFYLNPLLYS